MLSRLGPLTRCRVLGPPALAVRACKLVDRPLSARLASSVPKRKKEVLSLDDLPTSAIPSQADATVGPLDAILETKSKRTRKPKSEKPKPDDDDGVEYVGISPEEEAEYRAALKAGEIPDTPLSKLVWLNWKRFPDCILLTQVGNFYESYFQPAIEVSSLLGIKLTSKTYKTGQFPFTGFPINQIDKYLKILVQDYGFTVALVEERKDPLTLRDPKVDVKRTVTRVVTPGTLVTESWVSGNESRYLLAMAVGANAKKDGTGVPIYLAYADVSTGEFFTKDATANDIEDELTRISPREIVLDAVYRDAWLRGTEAVDFEGEVGDFLSLLRVLGVHVSFTELAEEAPTSPRQTGAKLTSALTLERRAITLLRQHLQFALRDSMPAMPATPEEFSRESQQKQMHIDAPTLQALEIRHALRPGGLMPISTTPSHLRSPLSVKGTLLSVMSRTVTDSGYRLLRRTLSAPSTSLPLINARLALVASLVDNEDLRVRLREQLKGLADVMRTVQKFRSHQGDGSDVWDVARWIRSVEQILARIQQTVNEKRRKPVPESEQAEGRERLREFVDAFKPLSELAGTIESAIDETALNVLQLEDGDADPDATGPQLPETKGEEEDRKRAEEERAMWWIRPSFSTELSDLHRHIGRLKAARGKLEVRLREEMAAPTLSLTQNARGAFVVTVKRKTEIGALDRSPDFYVMSETRASKTFANNEWSLLGAKLGRAYQELEVAHSRALNRLRAIVIENSVRIQHNAELVDELDLSAGFAQVAVEMNYVRPVLDEGTEMHIEEGRHPSVESGLMQQSRTFTPNTTQMNSSAYLHVVTGPNQGGKSTLLRQTAVIAILAQSGSFVPARSARIGIVDKVFSRIGARDDLYRDRSTFMLEMVETATILKSATPRSLVIMDEIGRGTTLNAGISIAYATLDYILKFIECRTLFATHYHELAHMLGAPRGAETASARTGVAFFCTDVEVDDASGSFTYSYRLKPGINYDSHAIKAAQLAGMPSDFLDVARNTLQELNRKESDG